MSATLRSVLKILKSDQIHKRFSSTVTARKLFYADYGDPVKVIQKEEDIIHFENRNNEVLVRMLAAPVNPADINTIQGKYPVKPALPSVPGNEGVGEVVAIGDEVRNLSVGDRVVPLTNALGTWRTHAVLNENHLFKIPKNLGIVEAATLTVNPCTAYRMLKDFVHLKPGATVLQNGGNSFCGQNVIQLCRAWDVNSINIVRDRPNIEQLKTKLKKLGATEVLTEEELRTTAMFKGKYKKPLLALNCVGGKSATELIRHMEKGGIMVTYGGMSMQPVTIPTAALIFKNVQIYGFWMTEWSRVNADSDERKDMFDDLITMMENHQLKSPNFELVPFDKYEDALSNTLTSKGMLGKKFILSFDEKKV